VRAAREPGGRGARGRGRRARDARVGRRMRACCGNLARIAARPRTRGCARARIASPARDARKKPRDRNAYARQTTWGRSGTFMGLQGLFPVSNGAMPPERAGDVEDVPSCAWVATADPRRRSPPCRSSLPVGGVSRHASRRAEWRRLLSVAYVERWFFILFARREKAGAGTRGALRTRAPATRDARRGHASDAEFDWPREPSRYARSASRNGPRVSQRRLFKSRLFFRAKKQRSRNDARRFVIPPSDSPTLRASRFENTRLIGSTEWVDPASPFPSVKRPFFNDFFRPCRLETFLPPAQADGHCADFPARPSSTWPAARRLCRPARRRRRGWRTVWTPPRAW
jgi:hypothetical protein